MYAVFNAMLASYMVIIYANKYEVVVSNQSKVLEEDGVQINDRGG